MSDHTNSNGVQVTKDEVIQDSTGDSNTMGENDPELPVQSTTVSEPPPDDGDTSAPPVKDTASELREDLSKCEAETKPDCPPEGASQSTENTVNEGKKENGDAPLLQTPNPQSLPDVAESTEVGISSEPGASQDIVKTEDKGTEQPEVTDVKEIAASPSSNPEGNIDAISEPQMVDPRMGKLVEQSKVLPSGQFYPLQGKVVAYQEPAGRLPPRWTINWESAENVILQDEWVAADLDAETPPVGNSKLVLDNIQNRYQQQMQQELESNQIVSTLIMYAAIEEALQTNLQNQQLEEGTASGKGTGKNENHHPALYYTMNPSSYLKPPTATDTSPSVSGGKSIMTAASLGQRVRGGSQWAWKYLQSQQPPPPAPLVPTNGRRSLRSPKAPAMPIVAMPTPVQPGGRVAMWWLQKLEEMANSKPDQPPKAIEKTKAENNVDSKVKKEVTEAEEVDVQVRSAEVGLEGNDSENEKGRGEESQVDDDDDNDDDDMETENKDDDDDDYRSNDAEMEEDDEDLQEVEKERSGNLSPLHTPGKRTKRKAEGKEIQKTTKLNLEEAEEVEEEAEEEEDDDAENGIINDNPYLKPSFAAFLEYLALPRALSGENLQSAMSEIMLRVKFNKRSSQNGLSTTSLTSVDQIVLDQETPDYPPGKVVLKCISDGSYSELQKLDAQAFSRCKFVLDVIGDEESTMQMQRKLELLQQEVKFKEEKAWAKWRHKGINEGFATWPLWSGAISQWVKDNFSTEPETLASNTDVSPTDDTKDDEALAKSLIESENAGSRRRTARRSAANSTEGVFYGNQSKLTQKQLMDALVRLVRSNQYQTLMRLQTLVADDSSDPIRRARVALGRLVWKRNQLRRKPVESELSDSGVAKRLLQSPILSVIEPSAHNGTQNMPPEISQEDQILSKYIQGLHKTELQLRKLVTKSFSEIPVAIIATAADERPGSMEALDASYFEDPSTIEWHKTGHDLLKKLIFRPASTYDQTIDSAKCDWYLVMDYAKSVESEVEEKEEPNSKERRMRFRAVAVPPPGKATTERRDILLLTEAQVQAGVKAAELEKRNQELVNKPSGNPFSGSSTDRISLIPVDIEDGDEAVCEIHGRIVGYDNVVLADEDEVEYRILVLPDVGDAFWASLDIRADTESYVCQPIGESTTWYSIEQFDYHQNSEAHKQCEAVLTYLRRQKLAGPFLTPVDPISLNIPSYRQIVKHPMDISTISEKLNNGQYSSILPGTTDESGPVARMLNGPFRKDIELMFDNAMLFNPPDDWIYKAASQLKKNALKKIADLSHAAAQETRGVGRARQKSSVYVDEDSDVDMYEYESDKDEDFEGRGRKARKRKRASNRSGAQKDELAARAIEHPIRLQHTLNDPNNLRGPFANLPINMSASTFTLPPTWSCRLSSSVGKTDTNDETESSKQQASELAELLKLQKAVEESESANRRRSSRANTDSSSGGVPSQVGKGAPASFEFFVKTPYEELEKQVVVPPTNRTEVEIQEEKFHEDFYAKLYQSNSNRLLSEDYGQYSNGSFPPYLGRVVPVSNTGDVSWEIRSPFVVPALRWVLRGLIQSGHLTAIEPMNADSNSGVVMTNDVYIWDDSLQPFETVEKKKRAVKSDEEESEEELEMSEYEKARAERVARNAERLKALGLA